MLLNYQLFNWNDNSLCGFFYFTSGCLNSANQKSETMSSFRFLKKMGRKEEEDREEKEEEEERFKHVDAELFLCIFFRPLSVASVHCRHFPMLLHRNKHELHKFIILLWESFFLILLYVCSEDRFPLLAPFFSAPTYFLLMECSDCVRPRCRCCVCFVGLLIPSSFSLLPVLFMKSSLPSSHQWDSGPHSVSTLKTVVELSPDVLLVFLPSCFNL